MTPNGRFVAYLSSVDGQGQGMPYGLVFVQDRQLKLIEMVSISNGGAPASGACSAPSISSDGRFISFLSEGSNLVPADTNDAADTFVRDRLTGTTERVNVGDDRHQLFGGDLLPNPPPLSADGRFVVFVSEDPSIAGHGLDRYQELFVRDRSLGTTERITVGTGGESPNFPSFGGSISADGRYVCFDSFASNLVPNESAELDVFVRDRVTETTERVSVSNAGVGGNGRSSQGMISADGRFVAFFSEASNLVPGDTNDRADVFVRDRLAGTTERVSVSTSGAQGDNSSGWEFGGIYAPTRLTADGRFVLFTTLATNLVRGRRLFPGTLLLHDRALHTTEPVLLSGGKPLTGAIAAANLSANGRYLTVSTTAPLERQDRNGASDFYLVDRHDPGSGKLRVKPHHWEVAPAGAEVPGGVQVTNAGAGSLTVAVAGVTGPFTFTGAIPSITLAPHQSVLLGISFQSETAGRHQGTLTLQSDDPRNPTLAVQLRAVAR